MYILHEDILGGREIMGTFEEPKRGPLEIREEYSNITILGWEKYWVTGGEFVLI